MLQLQFSVQNDRFQRVKCWFSMIFCSLVPRSCCLVLYGIHTDGVLLLSFRLLLLRTPISRLHVPIIFSNLITEFVLSCPVASWLLVLVHIFFHRGTELTTSWHHICQGWKRPPWPANGPSKTKRTICPSISSPRWWRTTSGGSDSETVEVNGPLANSQKIKSEYTMNLSKEV